MTVKFRQPNDLARALHQLLDQLEQGRTLILTFSRMEMIDGESQHTLEVLNEVATERRIGVRVVAVGPRSLEVSRVPDAA